MCSHGISIHYRDNIVDVIYKSYGLFIDWFASVLPRPKIQYIIILGTNYLVDVDNFMDTVGLVSTCSKVSCVPKYYEEFKDLWFCIEWFYANQGIISVQWRLWKDWKQSRIHSSRDGDIFDASSTWTFVMKLPVGCDEIGSLCMYAI